MIARLWRIVLAASLLFSYWLPTVQQTAAQSEATPTNNELSAQSLMAEMSVAERVGQLFLVTFQGDQAPNSSDIADLITNYHVGGVVLLAQNDNITGYGDLQNAPLQVTELVNSLQELALTGGAVTVGEETAVDADAIPPSPTPAPEYTPIPLFIATNYEGQPAPTEILNGLTQVPTNMTIGATWQPTYAQTVGQIVGRDLSALGINMIFGPVLDVLENPIPSSAADLGVRSFGGDPYWVGLMGKAYTTGIHIGSDNRMAVVAKHFPGNGSSDRPIYLEVPTVRKSLEQLKQIELAPFFAVTNAVNSPEAIADGLLTTHIRYQGFQGNIRATTVPVSFDPQALTTLMGLPEFSTWRTNGGVIVSDALGVRSVERFYDDTEQEFPHRRVAKDALLAGNDLLYLADFALGSEDYAAELANTKDTILWFRDKYVTDPSFQLRVDEAVLRILQLKLRLYGDNFALENVQRDVESLTAVTATTASNPAISELTQTAVTLISPSPAELVERLPSPPGADDQIIIFTDQRPAQQCNTCVPQPLISRTALEERILALYGPNASGQVQADHIRSFSFADLSAFLSAGPGVIVPPSGTPEPDDTVLPEDITPSPQPTATPPPEYWVQEWLRDASWIILAMQNNTTESQALQRLLAERTDILRDRKIIVFAYDAPYYLDTTEISKLSAYYGIFGSSSAAIDASVRALFQELPLSGKLPVSVSSIGYDLFQQTLPAPDQVLTLFIVSPSGVIQSPPSEEPLSASVGETLRLQTGVILDHNGNRVPDGTVVQFIQQDRIQGLVSIIGERATVNGVATFDYVLEARTGQFRITAVSGDAHQSQEVNIVIGDSAQVTIITPTPLPTPTATPTNTPTPVPTQTLIPTPLPSATPLPPPEPPTEPGVLIEWAAIQMLITMLSGLMLIGVFALLWGRHQQTAVSQRINGLLWGIIGGLLAYNYFGLGLPGTAVLQNLNSWAGLLITLFGGAAGLLLRQLVNSNR
ncbi:MAG: hypothetical protein H6662_10520 [Ardenticatenaceae bacterium]|nr:hypothetical protein [Ardenticatenaceae bacterium]MCB8989584.1 hypothetical protein [Ardenticatenaceae bacterium]MCB9003127.1 hypothetical protein [Ardenticatenaceae bacterium]